MIDFPFLLGSFGSPCYHIISDYNRMHDISYYPLLLTDRNQNRSLKDFNIEVNEIFKINSKLNELNVNTTVLYPDYISNSVYSNYVANDKIRKSYKTLEDAFDQILQITSSSEETFTYLYIPDIDDLEHDYGFDVATVLNEINRIETQL